MILPLQFGSPLFRSISIFLEVTKLALAPLKNISAPMLVATVASLAALLLSRLLASPSSFFHSLSSLSPQLTEQLTFCI